MTEITTPDDRKSLLRHELCHHIGSILAAHMDNGDDLDPETINPTGHRLIKIQHVDGVLEGTAIGALGDVSVMVAVFFDTGLATREGRDVQSTMISAEDTETLMGCIKRSEMTAEGKRNLVVAQLVATWLINSGSLDRMISDFPGDSDGIFAVNCRDFVRYVVRQAGVIWQALQQQMPPALLQQIVDRMLPDGEPPAIRYLGPPDMLHMMATPAVPAASQPVVVH